MNPESAAHIHPSDQLQGEDAMISDRKGDENRVTLQSITDKIVHKSFYRVGETGPSDDGLMTRCVLTMQHGFMVDGFSACQTAERFDKDLGEQLAYDVAIRKLYELEAYLQMYLRWHDSHTREVQSPTEKIEQAFPGSQTIGEADDDGG
jgi:hypothetical protein